MDHNLLLILAGVLVLGIFCQWLAWRLKVPAILPLLAAGFIVGPLMGLLHPAELLGDLFFPMVSLLVAIILFEGALTLNFNEVRSVAATVRNLILVGSLVTWVGAALAAHYVIGLDWLLSILFGALIIVTGPTVIAPLLRNVRPTQRIYSVLMWEGILIDPLGALLAVLVFDYIVAELGAGTHTSNPLLGFLEIVLVGAGIGLIGGWLTSQIVRRYLVPDFLRDLVVLSMVAGLFSISDSLVSESGLLAVTVMGLFLANSNLPQLREILHFKERLSVLFISGLFILLAANIGMDKLALLDWRSFVVLAIVILIIRPIGVVLSSLGSQLTRNERTFLSWIAPRGIVAAAVTALFSFRLQQLELPGAELLEPMVFLIIVGTVVLQGGSAKWVAQRLGVAEAEPQGFIIMGAHRFSRVLAEAIADEGFTVRLVDTNYENVRAARLVGLDVYYGNILSEYMEDQIPLSGIGRLLAMTSNDEANSLACRHLQDEFGSSEVYQLVPRTVAEGSRSGTPSPFILGRLLFNEQATYRHLLDESRSDAVVKKTSLTEQFGYSDFITEYGEDFIPLMAVKDQTVIVANLDEPFEPRPGWVLISLVCQEDRQQRAEGDLFSEPETALEQSSET